MNFKSYEVSPTKDILVDYYGDTEKCYEVCSPEEATQWSVYGRDNEELATWLADCPDQKTAEFILAALERPALDKYLSEFIIIDGLKQHPSGYNFEQWKNKRG